ncbi:MAG: hypothetical protein KJO07_04770 [Deltaproteobacteria bacterium]|nr:hypothetical protein [Deltaproteobacteria bacterium]
MRILTATSLAIALAGCSTAKVPGDIFDMGPDASPAAEEVLEDVGCLVTISYPFKADAPEKDHLIYDQDGRLVRSRRTYGDGLEAERSYTWSPDGREVVREWFDGSKRSQLDPEGKVIESTSYDQDGTPTWREELSYDGDLLVERKLFRLGDEAHYSTTSYDYDADRVTRQGYQNHVDSEDEWAIRYTYTVQSDGLKMVRGFDTDGDGAVEYKTAVVIAPSGLVERGVDENGELIDYEYQGEQCESVAASWAAADPFFVDL